MSGLVVIRSDFYALFGGRRSLNYSTPAPKSAFSVAITCKGNSAPVETISVIWELEKDALGIVVGVGVGVGVGLGDATFCAAYAFPDSYADSV